MQEGGGSKGGFALDYSLDYEANVNKCFARPPSPLILVCEFLWLIVQRQYVIIYIPTTSWALLLWFHLVITLETRVKEVVLFGYCTDGMTVMTRALNRGAPILFLHLYYKGEQLSYMLTIVVLLQLNCIETNYWSQRAFLLLKCWNSRASSENLGKNIVASRVSHPFNWQNGKLQRKRGFDINFYPYPVILVPQGLFARNYFAQICLAMCIIR